MEDKIQYEPHASFRIHYAKEVVNQFGGAVWYGEEERLSAGTLETALDELKQWKADRKENSDIANIRLLEIRTIKT